MAFHDIEVVLYDGTIKINYTDKTHRYQARPRLLNEDGEFLTPEDKVKGWGKALYPKGTTTLLGDTLEKKGLQRYPLTKAMMYMFQFYEFTDDDGEKKIGYSKKGEGSFWEDAANTGDADGVMKQFTRAQALEHLSYGSKADLRWTQKGASIGSVVHDAIEHYVKNQEFDIRTQYLASMEEAEYESERAKEQAKEEADADIDMALKAFESFKKWWDNSGIELLGAEDLIYSKKHNICGTFDALLRVPGKGVVLTDWKTSNASTSKSAGMPEGINYQYFIQSAIYAMAWEEMGREKIDDLAIVSCRKDGEFTVIYASDLGLTVAECYNWVRAVIISMKMMNKTKDSLWAHGEANGIIPKKPARKAVKK